MKRKACASERADLDDDEAALILAWPLSVSLWYTQEHIARTVRKMFPEEWSHGVSFPFIEDLINYEPFNSWAIWRHGEQLPWEASVTPAWVAKECKAQHSCFLGWQRGAKESKLAVTRLIPSELSMDGHFDAALGIAAKGGIPFMHNTAFDDDLRCSADWTIRWRSQLRKKRQSCSKAFCELSDRLMKFSKALKRHQSMSVRSVASEVHVGLIAVVTVIMCWPDW